MSIKKINNINYFVNNDEFNIIPHNEYTNLKIIDKLGYFEMIISFINKISHHHDLIFNNTTHGGFIPFNCLNIYNKLFILSNDLHFDNIIKNNNNNINSKINILIHKDFKQCNEFDNYILHDELLEFDNELFENYNFNVIISKKDVNNSLNYIKYHWPGASLFIYVNYKFNFQFCQIFKYFLSNDKMTLHYDNLNHLCIMVKNAGHQFEQMLLDNINQFDKWTI